MSLYSYKKSIRIVSQNFPLNSIIMAAMHQAAGNELDMLREAFPSLYCELMERGEGVDGVIADDK